MKKWAKPPSRKQNIDSDDPEVKDRKCLSCGVMFLSTWAGNRICYDCKPTIRKLQDDGLQEEQLIVTQKGKSKND